MLNAILLGISLVLNGVSLFLHATNKANAAKLVDSAEAAVDAVDGHTQASASK